MGLRLQMAKLWNRAVRVKPKMRGKYDVLLDLGCGMGHFCKMLRRHAWYIIGMDIYLPSLKHAKKTKEFDDLVLADILNPPIRRDRVDCVTLFDVVEHLEKRDAVELLKSFACTVFLSVPKVDFSNRLYAYLTKNRYENHKSFWTTEDFERLRFECEVMHPPLWLRVFPNQGSICASRIV